MWALDSAELVEFGGDAEALAKPASVLVGQKGGAQVHQSQAAGRLQV